MVAIGCDRLKQIRGDRGWIGQKSENRPLGFLAVS